jgi:RND family efflux transporter MFP subunit
MTTKTLRKNRREGVMLRTKSVILRAPEEAMARRISPSGQQRDPSSPVQDVLLRMTALAAIALMVVGCGEKPPKETPRVVRPVKTLVVGTGLAEGLTFPGTVRGSERGELSFQIPGPLVELPVDEGDRVSRGTLLARIDPTDYNLAIAEAQATYDQSVSDYRRYQRLYEKEAVPLADVELKRAVRDVSAAKLEQARNNLGYTYLRAPFPGRIGKKYVENFEDVRAKEPVLTLHRVDTVEVTIDVPESLVTRYRGDGSQALAFARFETHPDLAFPLKLKEISAEADAATQTYQAAFTMKQPAELNVFPGMSAQVTLRRRDAEDLAVSEFTVPAQAVFQDDGGRMTVWVVDPGDHTVHARAVEVGPVTGATEIVVRSGLEDGDMIAATAVEQLREGMEIRPLAAR